MKKIIAVFLVFFLGTSGLIMVDNLCRQSTGQGGMLSVEINKTQDGKVLFSFLGKETGIFSLK